MRDVSYYIAPPGNIVWDLYSGLGVNLFQQEIT